MMNAHLCKTVKQIQHHSSETVHSVLVMCFAVKCENPRKCEKKKRIVADTYGIDRTRVTDFTFTSSSSQ